LDRLACVNELLIVVETSLSLLDRMKERPEPEDWKRLVDLYTPLLQKWLGRCSLQPSDVEDLIQEVFSSVIQDLPHFQHDQRRGAFRRWLKQIVIHRLLNLLRTQRKQAVATGDSDMASILEQVQDPQSDLSLIWDEEHDRHIAGRLLEMVQREFSGTTAESFRRVVLQGASASAVAKELGISQALVWQAKCRVLRRLRQEAAGLLE